MQGSASSGNENGQQLVPSGKDMDKVRSELAFERQCNSELGRRNRRYLKVIDKFDSHRSVMDSHIAELSENLCKLTTLLQQGEYPNELKEIVSMSLDVCEIMKSKNSESNFSSGRSDGSEPRRSRRGSTVLRLDASRRSSQPGLDSASTISIPSQIGNDLPPTAASDTPSEAIPTESTKPFSDAIPLPTTRSKPLENQEEDREGVSPLFEHFLMIGCAEEDARDFSQQMKQMNADSITDRIKRTMTGIFTTQRQNSAQSSNPLSPENSSAANFFKFQNIRSRQDSNSQESSGPNGVIASSSSATATNAFNVGSIENALTPAAPSVSAPAPPLQRSTSKSLDMPSVSVKAVQSWMMGAMVGSRRPPSVASPEPATQSMLSVLPEDASDGSAIPNDTHSPDKAPDGIVGSNSSATPTAAEEEEETISLMDGGGRSSLAGFSQLTESIKSTSTSAGSTLSKIGGSFFTKMNSVPFSLTPPRGDAPGKASTSKVGGGPEEGRLSVDIVTAEAEQLLEPQAASDVSPIGQTVSVTDLPPPAPTSSASMSPRSTQPKSATVQPSSFASNCLFNDVKSGRAVITPKILFHFPENVPPPTSEVGSFCLPAGATIQAVPEQSEDALLKDILYPRSNSRNTQRSLVFWFEDRNLSPGGEGEKMYGICLITPRVLTIETPELPRQTFISYTCYAFITRYPFFDFFFRVLQDIVAVEKLRRMELSLSGPSESAPLSFYVPEEVLVGVLGRLSEVSAPKVADSIVYMPHEDLPVVSFQRKRPRYGWTEHDMDLAEWCLPGLFATLPVELILWALSFLLCEAKFIVLSKEAGLISVVTNGLQYLLKPLEWAGPFIPIVPTKMIEFVESPVPIIGGVPLDSYLQLSDIQTRCGGTEHLLTVLLDVDRHELLVPSSNIDRLPGFCMPSMESLAEKLHHILQAVGMESGMAGHTPDRELAYIIADRVATHIEALCVMAKSTAEKQKQERDRLHEEKLKLRHAQKIEDLRRRAEGGPLSPQPEGSDSEGDDDDDDDDDDDGADEGTKAEQLRLYYKQLVEIGENTTNTNSSGSVSTGNIDLRALLSAAMSKDNRHHLSPVEPWIGVNHLEFASAQDEFMNNFVATQMYNAYSCP